MKYYSAKGGIMVAVIILLITMTVLCFAVKIYPAFGLLIIVSGYIIWTWYDTYYIIDENRLFYKSALIKGSIQISTIVKVIKNKTLISGTRPALSTKGIIIKYNKYDEIFISPQEMDQFISQLKVINPNIKITE